jgi:hypothetical protein
VLVASIIVALMMEAASTSETSVNFYQKTRGNNPEDGHRHTRHHENLKSHFDYHVHTTVKSTLIFVASMQFSNA